MGQVKTAPDSRLERVIVALVYAAWQRELPLSQTRLMKLLYLAELYHKELYGRRITNADFVSWTYGPYSHAVALAEEGLREAGFIDLEPRETARGYTARVPRPKVAVRNLQLQDSVREVLALVLEEWGTKTTDKLVEFAKATVPFLIAEKGEPLDFERADVFQAIAEARRISRSEAATLVAEHSEGALEGARKACRSTFRPWEEAFS